MERHEEVIFSLLRSAMWGTPAYVPHDFNEWGQAIRLAKAQSVLGVVADMLLSIETIASCISTKKKEKLRSFMMLNMMTSAKLESLLGCSVQTLREVGIDPVLLKGPALAAYYPNPRLRQCGDIDLYVGQKNYRREYEALLKIADNADDIKVLFILTFWEMLSDNLHNEVLFVSGFLILLLGGINTTLYEYLDHLISLSSFNK